MNILGGGTGRGRGGKRAPAEEWIQEDKSGFNVASESLPGKREKIQNGARPTRPLTMAVQGVIITPFSYSTGLLTHPFLICCRLFCPLKTG